jgi:RimJ/RimL family protein N-acetyltransferase
MPILLETTRLILRPPTVADIDALVLAADHRSIARTMADFPSPFTRNDAVRWIESMSTAQFWVPDFKLIVLLKESEELVGGAALVGISLMRHEAELSYWCTPAHWGKGITTEAALRLVQYGFEEMELRRITSTCLAANVASRRVMEKVGMKYERTTREDISKSGKLEEVLNYAIGRQDACGTAD